jgi:uncharacterized RDD family membrane protein YckC
MDSDVEIRNRRAFDNWAVSGPGRRVLAFLMDAVCGWILLYALLFVTEHKATPVGQLFLWVVLMWGYEGISLALFGKTLGRHLTKIKVYSPKYDGIPHPLQISLRILIYWLTVMPLGLGLTSILYRRDRRGWHDLISETITIGPQKSLPNSFMQRFGATVMFAQALVVFATIGALLLSAGLRVNDVGFDLSSVSAKSTCDNPSILLNHTADTLFALSISPAWSNCWHKLSRRIEPIKDAKLSHLANLAHSYYSIWDQRSEHGSEKHYQFLGKLEKTICYRSKQDKSCHTARYLASITNPDYEVSAESWLAEHAKFYRILLKAKSQRVRLGILKEELPVSVQRPIVKSALKDRIWAEQLAMGRPRGKPQSLNPEWNQSQICWAEALGYYDSSDCGINPYIKPLQNIYKLDTTELTMEEAESFLIEAQQEGQAKEFVQAIKFWMTIQSENRQRIEKQWAMYPQTSPLYSYAKRWYQDYKQN